MKLHPKKKRKVSGSISVKIDEQLLMDACVSFVAQSGRPLCLIKNPGMRMLLDPILEGLGHSFTISLATVAAEIIKQTNELRQVLRKQLENRFVSLKVDGAKRLFRSVVGINVQYVEDGKVQLHNLSSVELKYR
jgi:hypothetical protein